MLNPTIYPAGMKQKIGPGKRRHLMLAATVLLLPFSYVPHEIIRSGPSVTEAVAGLAILTGARCGVLWRRTGAIDTAAIVLAIYLVLRLVVLSPLQFDIGVPWGEALRATGAVIAGVVLFRMARRPELRPVIVGSLKIVLVMLLLIEAYQLSAGLPHLLGLGYSDGFYYYTTVDYRPFGTFLSPTVFGCFLAMVGAVVVASARGWRVLLWLVPVVAGLAFTETRAAWIAFGAAMIAVLVGQSRRSRTRVVVALAPLAVAALLLALTAPEIFRAPLDQLAALSDERVNSNSSRMELWGGALAAAADSPLIGYAPANLAEIGYPYIGPVALLGHAHNNYLQILFLYGVTGLGLLLTVLGLALAGILRQLRAGARTAALPALAGLTVFLVDSFFETTWTSLSVVTLLFLVIGLGLPATRQTQPPGVSPQTAVPAASRHTVPSE